MQHFIKTSVTVLRVVLEVSKMIAPGPLNQRGRNHTLSIEEVKKQETLILFENKASQCLLSVKVVFEVFHSFK